MLKRTVPILVILLILGGMYFLAKKYHLSAKTTQNSIATQASLSATMSASQKKESQNAIITVQKFYNSYMECMKGPQVSPDQNQSVYCLSHNDFVSDALIKSISKADNADSSIDPVICAQSLPQSTQVVGTSPIMSGTTSAVVVATYGAGSTVNIQAEMIRENGSWKVEGISCPRF